MSLNLRSNRFLSSLVLTWSVINFFSLSFTQKRGIILKCGQHPAQFLMSSYDIDRTTQDNLANVKSRLFAICATTDRGFGANKNDRRKVDNLIDKLQVLQNDKNPTRGLNELKNTTEDVPLRGVWRMVYTTALDVLSLNSNPFTQLQGIYQGISAEGRSVNVIDLVPKFQVLLPSELVGEGFLTRALVYTTATKRSATRVGLQFNNVELKQISAFGQKISSNILPKFKFDLTPNRVIKEYLDKQIDDDLEKPGFFDVLYLDHDLLIIRQNEPGGIFINIRDDDETIMSYITN